jgi:glycosyltransferase involved in cell wall biosynthesis
MSVFNDKDSLTATVNSILAQEDVALEFIIINDGSDTQTSALLEELRSNDSRIKLISHDNIGLTKSLRIGCALAKGRYIARQDNGDISLPGRLAAQIDVMENNQDVVMVSTGTRFLTPKNEHLYDVIQSDEQANSGLKSLVLNEIEGPSHHGSVMFRASSYQRAGGYRNEFFVAQDLDLWKRLIEIGRHFSVEKIFYTSSFEKNSISSRRRELQTQTKKLILECSLARLHHGNDSEVLVKVRSLFDTTKSNSIKINFWQRGKSDSDYYYFLGSNFLGKNKKAALHYFVLSIRAYPFTIKPYAKLLIALAS